MSIRPLITVLATICCLSFTTKSTPTDSTCTDCRIFTPNAFSPNDDGINDEFRPLPGANCTITDYSLKIYDRKGALVFSSNSLERGWDGKFRAESAPSAVYYYVYRYTALSEDGNEKKVDSGDVSLLR